MELDGDRIGGSTEALGYPEVPKHLVVIGAGYMGLELGSVWRRLGAKVTVLEYLGRILPGMDAEIAREAERTFEKQGIEFKLGARVTSAIRSGDEVTVGIEGQDTMRCDRVLLAVGRGCPIPTIWAWIRPVSCSIRAVECQSTISFAPWCLASTRSATWCAARCWRTKRKKKVWRASKRSSPALVT